MNENLSLLYNAILDGDEDRAQDAVQAALAANLQAEHILAEGMIAAMREVGCRFEQGEYYVPEMLVAAHTMQSALTLLKPYLVAGNVKSAGKVAIGTVKGDLHDIGKNLVMLMLEGAGFEIQDLGVDVAPEKFVEAISTSDANIVALCCRAESARRMPSRSKSCCAAGAHDSRTASLRASPTLPGTRTARVAAPIRHVTSESAPRYSIAATAAASDAAASRVTVSSGRARSPVASLTARPMRRRP